MIISASRRTDIPALFSDWFFDRLAEGEVEVANPFNPALIRRVSLQPADVDGFVFWSKNPSPMLKRLAELEPFTYYFQFTLNGYGREVETRVPETGYLTEIFHQLAANTGPDRIVWRYDPIFISDQFTTDWHLQNFQNLADKIAGATDTCMISFGDVYRKNVRRIKALGFRPPTDQEILKLAAGMSQICQKKGINLQTCSEVVDLSGYGIGHARCVDAERLARLASRPVAFVKDKNQRPACGCAQSVDIGRYDSCTFGCKYCYANR